MGSQRKDGFHRSTQSFIHERRPNDCQDHGKEPKGIGSGIRMIQYFINRAGKNLSMTRKRELEKAKKILQKRDE
jgi:hypothetical protein